LAHSNHYGIPVDSSKFHENLGASQGNTTASLLAHFGYMPNENDNKKLEGSDVSNYNQEHFFLTTSLKQEQVLVDHSVLVE